MKRLLALLLLAAMSMACAAKPIPLAEFKPQPGTFDLHVGTFVGVDSMGALVRKPINANVVPARKAIEAFVAKGYEYTPANPDARYIIDVSMTCFDPVAAEASAEQQMFLDDVDPYPFGGDMFGRTMEQVTLAQTWHPLPTLDHKSSTCAGRLVVTVVDRLGGKDTKYRGGVFVRGCPYDDNCPYDTCAPGLDAAMAKAVKKVF